MCNTVKYTVHSTQWTVPSLPYIILSSGRAPLLDDPRHYCGHEYSEGTCHYVSKSAAKTKILGEARNTVK